MPIYEVRVARDRTEYVTIKVKADSHREAIEAGLEEALDDQAWEPGDDVDSPYLIDAEEAK